MRTLIVEDNFVNRKYLSALLKPYGDCDIAINGLEAIDAFRAALDSDDRYDLICLDIMMPEMDGRETLDRIRKMESEEGIEGLDRVKILMTTAICESKSVLSAFRNGCEGYLIKPIKKLDLINQLEHLELIVPAPSE